MLSLPRGYYAVAADFENAPKDTFTYKGVTYAVEEGVNLFATALEADAAASETPEAVLEGLDYDHFEAPVLLFSKGVHSTKRLLLRGARYLLGEGAGINPNLPVTDPLVGGERYLFDVPSGALEGFFALMLIGGEDRYAFLRIRGASTPFVAVRARVRPHRRGY